MQSIILFYRDKGKFKYNATRAVLFNHTGVIFVTPGDDFIGIKSLKKRTPHEYLEIFKRFSIADEIVLVESQKCPKKRYFVNKFSKTCNEVVRSCCQLDTGFTWTPNHLFKQLIKLDGKRNFKILERIEHE